MQQLAPQQTRTFFVTSATYSRRSIFQSDRHATLFCELLKSDRDSGRYQIHELVLMPNHFHLIITPAYEVSLEKAIQFIKGGFSYRVKKELGSIREIWQAGYNSHNIQNAEDYEKHRGYIHGNPVRAGLVSRPQEYTYSSAHPNMRDMMDSPPPWLKPLINEL